MFRSSYVVRRDGEALRAIAERAGVDAALLARLNRGRYPTLTAASRLLADSVIDLPESASPVPADDNPREEEQSLAGGTASQRGKNNKGAGCDHASLTAHVIPVRAVGGLLWWDNEGVERRVAYTRGALYSFPARMTHAIAPFPFSYWAPLRVNLQFWTMDCGGRRQIFQ